MESNGVGIGAGVGLMRAGVGRMVVRLPRWVEGRHISVRMVSAPHIFRLLLPRARILRLHPAVVFEFGSYLEY